MKEYLVHIEIDDKDQTHKLIFRSSTLAVAFMAIDDFLKAVSTVVGSDRSIIMNTQSVLDSLSSNFERQLITVDEQDQFDEQEEVSSKIKSQTMENNNNEQQSELLSSLARQEPQLKVTYPGAV